MSGSRDRINKKKTAQLIANYMNMNHEKFYNKAIHLPWPARIIFCFRLLFKKKYKKVFDDNQK